MSADLIERLRASAYVYQSTTGIIYAGPPPIQEEAAAHIESLEARIEAMRAALEPFAEASVRFDAAARGFNVEPRPDSYVPRTVFTHGELRAARAAREATR